MPPALDIPADLQISGRTSRVIAVIRPFRVDDVMARLSSLEPQDVAVELVRGYGRQKDHLTLYDEHDPDSLFLPKVRIEFNISGERLRQAVDAIRIGAATGRMGDGKIFIQSVESVPISKAAEHSEAGGELP
jgi:nitrogen regulatory protein PII